MINLVAKPLLEIAKAVIQTEADSILMLKDRIDQTLNDACQLLLSCEGKVILIGMGKSGHIAKKIAATLASTGTPSFYVHPGEAGHGDLGMVNDKDVVIISMIIASICDPLAGLFGQKYGKIKLVHNKTLEGTYIFIISSFLLVSIYTSLVSSYFLIICFLIALTELITPMKYDNITIPIISSIIFTIYNYL